MDAIDAVLTFLVNAAWQVPVLGAVAVSCTRFRRHASAQDRERLWRATLFLGVLLPLFSVLRAGLPPSLAPVGVVSPAVESSEAIGATVAPPITAPLRPDVARGLVIVFAVFVALRLCVVARAWRACRRLVRAATGRPPIEILRLARGCAASMGVTRAEVWMSDRVAGPVTVGVWRPVVLLPRVYETASAEMVGAVLTHEMAHVRRQDYAWNLALAIVSAPVAFHPSLWMMFRRWSREREMACDELVCATGRSWRRYARALVQAATWIVSGPRPASAMGLGGSLEERIMRLREGKGVIVPASMGSRLAAGAALGGSLLLGAVFTVAVDVARVDAAVARVEQVVSAGQESLRDMLEPPDRRVLYQADGRRDPFVDLRRAEPGPVAEGPARYRIGELSLRGIVKSEPAGRILLVWTPSNKTYFVRVGQRFLDGELVAIGDSAADFRQASAPFGGPVQTVVVRRELHTPTP